MVELEKQDAGGDESAAREQETGTEDEGDAVLGALETNHRHGGEHEREKTRGDLKVALQGRFGVDGKAAEPVGEHKHHYEARQMQEEPSISLPVNHLGQIAHFANP